jgi:hypothetical protein
MGLSASEIMTIMVLYHGSRYRYFKNFYQGVVLAFLKPTFPVCLPTSASLRSNLTSSCRG